MDTKKPATHPGTCALLKPMVHDKLVHAISQGATYRLACAFAGIHHTTLRRYLRLGGEAALKREGGDTLTTTEEFYSLFYYEVQLAEANAGMGWLKNISEASKVKWQAAAWLLERRFPKEYGKRTQTESVSVTIDASKWAELRAKRLKAASQRLLENEDAGIDYSPPEGNSFTKESAVIDGEIIEG